MNRALIVGGGALAGALVARFLSSELARGSQTRGAPKRPPDGALPSSIASDLSAIRENTDRVLEMLESERALEPSPPSERSEERSTFPARTPAGWF